MKHISIMIKPASSLCNMRCKYCFYENVKNLREVKSFGIMKDETMISMLKNIEKDLVDGDNITFAFQGGEPMLAGLDYFKNFVYEVSKFKKKVNVSYALQTNAMNIDIEWGKFLYENNFLLGISLDLLKKNHDDVRVDYKNQGTWETVINSMKILDECNVEYNVLCTLTNDIARYPKKVWNQIISLDIKYVQFTPCLGELNSDVKSKYAITPNRFASFYIEIFQLWLKDFQENKYRSIKLFDDIVNMLGFGMITACGLNGKCSPHIIVEADGSVYPCDFYCLDEYKIGNITEKTINELLEDSINSACKTTEKLPEMCHKCNYFRICGGNCKRMRKEICFDKTQNYCGYANFLNRTIKNFITIAQNVNTYKY